MARLKANGWQHEYPPRGGGKLGARPLGAGLNCHLLKEGHSNPQKKKTV
jgi:hypothetical protein